MNLNVKSEYGKLKSVFIHIPILENFIFNKNEIKFHGYNKSIVFNSLLSEIYNYINKLEKLGIKVYTDEKYDIEKREVIKKYGKIFPNLIYFRDLLYIIDNKVIVSRPYLESRVGEEEYAVNIFSELFDCDFEFIKKGTFEATDIFRLNNENFVINCGHRTDETAFMELKENTVLKNYQVEKVYCNQKHKIPQHLQGGKNIFNENTIGIRCELDNQVFQFNNIILLSENKEITKKFAMNIINIDVNEIIMPSNCPNTQKIFEDHNIVCHTAKMNEMIKGAGGFTCITLPLERD